jgi:hypothetical protein
MTGRILAPTGWHLCDVCDRVATRWLSHPDIGHADLCEDDYFALDFVPQEDDEFMSRMIVLGGWSKEELEGWCNEELHGIIEDIPGGPPMSPKFRRKLMKWYRSLKQEES